MLLLYRAKSDPIWTIAHITLVCRHIAQERSFARTYISISIELSLDACADHKHDVSMKLEIASFQLEALGNPVRLTIYRRLVRAGAEGLPVGAVQEKLGVAASTLSHHLKRLVEAGLVTQERQGTTLLCRAHFPAMTALIGYLSDECCADGKTTPACAPTSARAKASR